MVAYRRTKARNELLAVQKEKILQQSEALEEAAKAKSLFFANVSHELRTPVTLITGMLEVLHEKMDTNKHKNLKRYIFIIASLIVILALTLSACAPAQGLEGGGGQGNGNGNGGGGGNGNGNGGDNGNGGGGGNEAQTQRSLGSGVIIDKDGNPRWSPSTLGDVPETLIEGYFEHLPDGELAIA